MGRCALEGSYRRLPEVVEAADLWSWRGLEWSSLLAHRQVCRKVARIVLMCLLYFEKELLPTSETEPQAVQRVEGKQQPGGDWNGHSLLGGRLGNSRCRVVVDRNLCSTGGKRQMDR